MGRYTVIACKVMEEEILSLAPQGYELHFLNSELHRSPERLRQALQEAIDCASGSDFILLGYGLCGGALEGLRARTTPLVIPKVDDCIPLLLGSWEARRQWGLDTYFLSAGWLAGEDNLIREYERCLARYGKERGRRIMRHLFCHYRRLIFINTGRLGEDVAKEAAREVAEKLGLSFEITSGNKNYLRQLLLGPWDYQFWKVQPGQEVLLAGLHDCSAGGNQLR